MDTYTNATEEINMQLEYTGKGEYCFSDDRMAGVVEFCPIVSTYMLKMNMADGFKVEAFKTLAGVKNRLKALSARDLLTS